MSKRKIKIVVFLDDPLPPNEGDPRSLAIDEANEYQMGLFLDHIVNIQHGVTPAGANMITIIHWDYDN